VESYSNMWGWVWKRVEKDFPAVSPFSDERATWVVISFTLVLMFCLHMILSFYFLSLLLSLYFQSLSSSFLLMSFFIFLFSFFFFFFIFVFSFSFLLSFSFLFAISFSSFPLSLFLFSLPFFLSSLSFSLIFSYISRFKRVSHMLRSSFDMWPIFPLSSSLKRIFFSSIFVSSNFFFLQSMSKNFFLRYWRWEQIS